MKADIHPAYNEIKVTCSCGNTFTTQSTYKGDLHIEVCSECHPFYSGKQKILDTAGQVDKFNRKYRPEAIVEKQLKKLEAIPAIAKALNKEQRIAVVTDQQRQLILAGAGTGKTQAMAGKAAWNIINGADPQGIWAMSFTNKAAEEIKDRITLFAGERGRRVNATTIHKFAMQIIKKATGIWPRIDDIANDEAKVNAKRQEWIKKALDETLKKNPSLETAARTCIDAATTFPVVEGRIPVQNGEKKNFVYRLALEGKDLEVKSMAEYQIARILHSRKMPFDYEKPFLYVKDKVGNQDSFKPDFTINLNINEEKQIILEHWAVSKEEDGELHFSNRAWPPEEITEYLKNKEYKKKIYKREGVSLAETDSIQLASGNSDSIVLTAIAEAAGTTPEDLDKEYPVKIKHKPTEKEIPLLAREIDAWMRLIGARKLDPEKIQKRITKMVDMNMMMEANALHNIARLIYEKYREYLIKNGTYDFFTVLEDAVNIISKQGNKLPVELLLVDEYQDVNPAQEELIEAVYKAGKKKGTRLCVVGDDWQSIYSFNGADPSIMARFEKKANARTDLVWTMRFGNARAQATRAWAMQGKTPKPIDKEIKGEEDGLDTATEMVGRLPLNEVRESPEKAIKTIFKDIQNREKGKEACVMIIARAKHSVEDSSRSLTDKTKEILYSWESDLPSDLVKLSLEEKKEAAKAQAKLEVVEGFNHTRIKCAAKEANLTLDLDTRTVHKAKGMSADYVIFLQGQRRRIPKKLEEDALERSLAPLRAGASNPNDEERRVWYVALTRARKMTYVIEPPARARERQYADELWNNGERYLIGKKTGEGEMKSWRPSTPCPKCKQGNLFLFQNRETKESFVGCSNYPGCRFTQNIPDTETTNEPNPL